MKQLPNVKPFYAVKCNPNRDLLQTMARFGAGFDCASERELIEVGKASTSKGKLLDFQRNVIYANPCKSIRDVTCAHNFGAPPTVVDSYEEIHKLKKLGWKGGALIRIRVEDSGSLMPFSNKFGVDPKEVKDLAAFAYGEGFPIKGISFHVGSGCKDPKQYKHAVQSGIGLVHSLKEIGHDAKTVDIGGGFMGDEESFERNCRAIREGIYTSNYKDLQFIAEPGRFFASDAVDLFVQVIGKKPGLSGKSGEYRYTIDESLYGQFSCIPFDQQKPKWIRVPKLQDLDGKKPRKTVKGTLFGRTCDSLDMIASADEMEELEVGDWLWFPHMGAYTSVTASEFNGFPAPPQHGSATESVFLPAVEDVLNKSLVRFPKGMKYVKPVSLA